VSAPLKEIGGVQVSFGRLPARRAYELQFMIARSLSAAAETIEKAKGNPLAIQLALLAVLKGFTKEEFLELSDAMLSTITYGGKKWDWDLYRGGQLDLDRIIMEALKVNYPDFFGVFRDALAASQSPDGTSVEGASPATSP
jgi:hypothetical protein